MTDNGTASDRGNRGIFDGFEASTPQSTEDVDTAIKTSLVSLDANLLLNMYRFSPPAREALIAVLHGLNDRVWVSHQAAAEFWRRRIGVIDDRKASTVELGRQIDSAEKSVLQALSNWGKGTSAPKPILEGINRDFAEVFEKAREQIEEVTSESASISYDLSTDEVLTALRGILEGCVGPPLDADAHSAAIVEAQRRIGAEQPPGYRDAKKEGGEGPDGGAGDYLVWVQSVAEASRRSLSLAIVTGDEKEDWWWRHRGTLLGPRTELVNEMFNATGNMLYMLRPAQLIERAALLDVQVSDQAVQDVARATNPSQPSWNVRAVNELLRRLDSEGAVQAEVIRAAAKNGGSVDRAALFAIAGYAGDRMLRGFTKPTKRIMRDLQAEGIIDIGVEDVLTPIYRGVLAEEFEIPSDVQRIIHGEEAADS